MSQVAQTKKQKNDTTCIYKTLTKCTGKKYNKYESPPKKLQVRSNIRSYKNSLSIRKITFYKSPVFILNSYYELVCVCVCVVVVVVCVCGVVVVVVVFFGFWG